MTKEQLEEKNWRNVSTQGQQSANQSLGGGNASKAADERVKKGLGLHELVRHDGTNKCGFIRRSLNRFEPVGNVWRLNKHGVALSFQDWIDGSSSYGRQAYNRTFESLERGYSLLMSVVKGYDPQISLGVFNDHEDGECTMGGQTQFEADDRIWEQMQHLRPNDGGCGNAGEESQYALFTSAYLANQSCFRLYGKKGYCFVITDEPFHDHITDEVIANIFGDGVYEAIKENTGKSFSATNLPTVRQVANDLRVTTNTFAFVRVPGRYSNTVDLWKGLLGAENVVVTSPEHENHIAAIKAAVVAITEGALAKSEVFEFLSNQGQVPTRLARELAFALVNIPFGVNRLSSDIQLPEPGSIFASKLDAFPTAESVNFATLAQEANPGDYNWV